MILQYDGNITLKAHESENRQTISTVITSNRPDEPSYQDWLEVDIPSQEIAENYDDMLCHECGDILLE